MPTLPAFYGTQAEWECPHARTRLCRDVSVVRDADPWYVACADCGAAGPPADTETEALEAWNELVEVLDVWTLARAGDQSAAALVRSVVVPTSAQTDDCDHPCREYFESGVCACTRRVAEQAIAFALETLR
jgi:hypothetical protein